MCKKRATSRDRDKVDQPRVKPLLGLAIKLSQPRLAFRLSRQTKKRKMFAPKNELMPKNLHFITSVVFMLHLLFSPAQGVRQSHYVHWNTTNPIFRIDNTDHIIDVNRGNKPWEYDQVNIICPVYRQGTGSNDMETYIIYSVSKEEYESCRITNPNPRVIAICDKPHELMYFTITFRSFTPTPGGLEFQPGENYYFISTSAKGDLYRRVGGHCSSHHMKVTFKVASNRDEPTTPGSRHRAVVNVPRHYQETPPLSMDSSEKGRDDSDHTEDLLHTYWSGKGYLSGVPMTSSSSSKKRDNFQRHPNDVIKHEASRMASDSIKFSMNLLFLMTSALLPIFIA